jgi:hypothetical protein
MRVEVLFFDGCPNHEALLPRLRELLNAGGAEDTEIALVRVEDADGAEAERFLGSPTVRIDGQDVEPGADQRIDFGLKCRLFTTPEGLRGIPADEWVLGALERARTDIAAKPGPRLTAGALRDTFPACEDAPLALALVRLLARGAPVTDGMLAAAARSMTSLPNSLAGRTSSATPPTRSSGSPGSRCDRPPTASRSTAASCIRGVPGTRSSFPACSAPPRTSPQRARCPAAASSS